MSVPEKETENPRSRAAFASAGPYEKQWNTPPISPRPSRSTIARRSSIASRQWRTRGLRSLLARATCRAKASRWTSAGATFLK